MENYLIHYNSYSIVFFIGLTFNKPVNNYHLYFCDISCDMISFIFYFIWVLSFSFVNLARCLSILMTVLKNQLFVLLIFSIVLLFSILLISALIFNISFPLPALGLHSCSFLGSWDESLDCWFKTFLLF